MLPYCELDPKEHISVKLWLRFKSSHSRKCPWKCRLRKRRPFGLGLNVINVMFMVCVGDWQVGGGGGGGGLWGFLWWAPSAKRKDHHRVSSRWSIVSHRSNTGQSSTQYEQIPIILGIWPFWLTPFFLAATKQLYKWYFPSVCPSVCHTFLTMFPSSYHHEIFRSYCQWPK